MKRTIGTIILSLVCFLLSSHLGAQENIALAFSAIPMDVKALSMGGNTLLGGDMSWSALSNPAAAPFNEKKFSAEVGGQLWAPTKEIGTTAFGAGVSYSLGSLNISAALRSGNGKPYEIFGKTGITEGTFTPNEMTAALGVSYKVLDFVSIGGSAKYLTTALGKDFSMNGIAASVIATGRLSGLGVAAGIVDLGGKVKTQSGSYSLPTAIEAGVGYELKVAAQHAIDLCGQIDYFLAGGLQTGLGVQYEWNGTVAVRGGANLSSKGVLPTFYTVGVGLNLSGFKVDVCYLTGNETLANTLTFGVGYTF